MEILKDWAGVCGHAMHHRNRIFVYNIHGAVICSSTLVIEQSRGPRTMYEDMVYGFYSPFFNLVNKTHLVVDLLQSKVRLCKRTLTMALVCARQRHTLAFRWYNTTSLF